MCHYVSNCLHFVHQPGSSRVPTALFLESHRSVISISATCYFHLRDSRRRRAQGDDSPCQLTVPVVSSIEQDRKCRRQGCSLVLARTKRRLEDAGGNIVLIPVLANARPRVRILPGVQPGTACRDLHVLSPGGCIDSAGEKATRVCDPLRTYSSSQHDCVHIMKRVWSLTPESCAIRTFRRDQVTGAPRVSPCRSIERTERAPAEPTSFPWSVNFMPLV